MSFTEDLRRFELRTLTRSNAVFVNTASAVKASITDGSPITGAPGQPVDTSFLKNSWILDFPAPGVAEITTGCAYAPVIEYNVRGARLRSAVGGFHSVALTVAGFPRLVEAVNAAVP